MADDWEEDAPSSTDAPAVGRVFGGRGRGFKPPQNGFGGERRPGPKRDDNFGDNGGVGGKFRGNSNGNKENEPENGELKPKRVTYIPDEPTNDEHEMFGTGISSGINFDKYDSIEVRVSGENIPPAIKTFQDAGLKSLLNDNIGKSSYRKPTPVQKHALPIIMAGRDLMACAQTGSGKTAAFLLPIINAILTEPGDATLGEPCQPHAVIVSPTRELSQQIYLEARKFANQSFLKVQIVYGGTQPYHQLDNLKKGCHILVATLGRLTDFINRGRVSLAAVRFVVLDEADRMLDMGFQNEMRQILEHSTMTEKGDRQTLMFSATFPDTVQRLAGEFLNDYIFLAVGEVGGACSDVDQKIYSVEQFGKREKLKTLLNEKGTKMTLVFVEQKRMADIIATFLSENGIPTTSIHGDREQRERELALRDFKQGNMDVLVATSVASRGLDIKNVAHVINYDLPKDIDDYVHRIGRTGRVGNKGLSTAFYDPNNDAHLACDLVKILKQAHQEVPDFLLNVNSAVGSEGRSGGRGRSNFGGRDFRNDNRRNGNSEESPSDSTAFQDAPEEEEW